MKAMTACKVPSAIWAEHATELQQQTHRCHVGKQGCEHAMSPAEQQLYATRAGAGLNRCRPDFVFWTYAA